MKTLNLHIVNLEDNAKIAIPLDVEALRLVLSIARRAHILEERLGVCYKSEEEMEAISKLETIIK
jgi:hypothetical protein